MCQPNWSSYSKRSGEPFVAQLTAVCALQPCSLLLFLACGLLINSTIFLVFAYGLRRIDFPAADIMIMKERSYTSSRGYKDDVVKCKATDEYHIDATASPWASACQNQNTDGIDI